MFTLRKRSALAAISSALCFFLFLTGTSAGQSITGTLVGTVHDASGAVVSQANVTITNQATGLAIKTTTDQNGQYTAPSLASGSYRVQVEVNGFKAVVTQGIIITVNQTSRQDFSMEPGQVTEVVNVTETAPLVQSNTSDLGEVVESRQIQALPLNGRLFSQLVALTPGAVQRGFADFGENPAAAGAQAPVNSTVNGLPWSGNNYLIDGVANNEPLNAFINISPPLEAIQEFKVQTNNPSAEYGVFGGAIINLSMRSGTNEIHGTAFEYMRNDALNARNFFAQERGRFKTNQFGGTLGGPIRRNKAFFFMDYQGTLGRVGNTNRFTVPTVKQRAGDLSEESNTVFDPVEHTPFSGNRIPAEKINPISAQVANLFPLPNLPGLSNNYVENTNQKSDQHSFDVRVDFQVTSKGALFARESFSQRTLDTPAAGNQFMEGGSLADSRNQNAVVGYTHTFSPTKVWETRIGFNRFAVTQTAPDFGIDKNNELGIPNGNIPGLDYTSGIARFEIAGFRRTGSDGFLNSQRIATTFQYTSNFTWIAGRHSIKFGGDVRRIQSTLTNGQNAPRGQFNFDGNYTSNFGAPDTGSSFGSFLLGFPTQVQRDFVNTRPGVRMTFPGFFFQDDFRVTSGLTLNIGVRWDLFTHPVEKFNRQSNFSLSDGMIHLATSDNRGPDVDNFYNSWAPRIGFSYTPDRGITAIRGAYGISYFPDNFGSTGGTLERNFPFFETSSVHANDTFIPNLSVSNGLPGQTPLDLSSPIISPPAGFAVFMIPKNFRQDMAQMWNLGVQRQLGTAAVFEITYVGTRGIHLFRDHDINVPRPGPGDVTSRRPFFPLNPNITEIHLRNSDGRSYYNGLQAKISKRFSNGFQALLSYTYSRTIDNVSQTLDPYNDELNRGPSSGFKAVDIPQNFVVSYSYDLPFGRGKRFGSGNSRIKNGLISGWSINGITTIQSGEPLFIQVSSSQLNNGTGNWADVTCSKVPTLKMVNRWFETGCFANPAPFTYGNSGIGHVRGPGIFNFDFSIGKITNFDDKRSLQFRAEFFNIFNHARFSNPGTTLGNSDFGIIGTTTGTPRQVQLGLKFAF